jgi:CO/xanthine dehydrogenase Mo-binding subunit
MIPATLQSNPSLDRWVGFEPGGVVRIAFGKTEYGQGITTALAQIAADELDVSMARLRIVPLATGAAPDEGMTVGSMTIETSGASVRAACAEVRALMLDEASRRLDCAIGVLDIVDGAVMLAGEETGEDYWSLARTVDLARPATGEAEPKSPGAHTVVGESQPRLDLPAKVFGAAFLQDMSLPGMVHARVLRQPSGAAHLVSLDEAPIRRAAGADIEIIRDHDFIALVAPNERAAAAALEAAERHVAWAGVADLSPALSEPISLRDLPQAEHLAGAPVAEQSNRRRYTAAYSRPYISHGSMAPSCGVARFAADRLTVWTHGQSVYPLRQTIARITGRAAETIDVHHAQGAGCYGHNGADDAAIDAALIALRRPGAPVRVQWRREDEFGYAPVGTAMHIELTAELDAAGRVADWTTEVWDGLHVNRGRALVETALPGIPPAPPMFPPPPPGVPAFRFSGGLLNAVPSYDIPASRTVEHLVTDMPVRTSSLRGLGGPVNTYAGECFIDELAAIAGQDPLAYRLGMVSEPRGRQVLERVAAMAGWARRGAGGGGQGLGLAYDRHRDRGAFVAVVAAVSVETEVRLTHLWCVTDAGLIINPDGAKNQLEGGMIMAASWALKEQVRLDGRGIASVTWEDYPILRFDEVPPVDIELIDAPDQPPLGMGEVSLGPTLAAVGNAVAHALGDRIRDLPLTRDRIARSILSR